MVVEPSKKNGQTTLGGESRFETRRPWKTPSANELDLR